MPVVIAVVVVVLLAGAVLALRRRRPDSELDRFTAARAVTGRWADDPSSAPQPVLDIPRSQARVPDAEKVSETAD